MIRTNPLGKVNNLCRLLQLFLRAHSGFMRSEIQSYLNIFSVIMNQPENQYPEFPANYTKVQDGIEIPKAL
jgi:hypothetical protein